MEGFRIRAKRGAAFFIGMFICGAVYGVVISAFEWYLSATDVKLLGSFLMPLSALFWKYPDAVFGPIRRALSIMRRVVRR